MAEYPPQGDPFLRHLLEETRQARHERLVAQAQVILDATSDIVHNLFDRFRHPHNIQVSGEMALQNTVDLQSVPPNRPPAAA